MRYLVRSYINNYSQYYNDGNILLLRLCCIQERDGAQFNVLAGGRTAEGPQNQSLIEDKSRRFIEEDLDHWNSEYAYFRV